MRLKLTGTYQQGNVNDIHICQELKGSGCRRYILWTVRSREIIKILAAMEELACINAFAGEEGMCYLFQYEEPRPVMKFFRGEAETFEDYIGIYKNIVSLCMTEKSSYPILYLLIKEKQIQLNKNREVYFTYLISLDELDDNITEEDCVRECALFLLELMAEQDNKTCRQLIEKKAARNAYHSFIELYQDIGLLAEKKKYKLSARLFYFFPKPDERRKSKWIKIFLRLTVILAVLAAVILLSRLIFGDIPVFRLLTPAFQKIGTESLRQ